MGVSIGIVAIVLFISFLVFLTLGLQVSLGIGLASFIALLLSLPFDMTVIASAQKISIFYTVRKYNEQWWNSDKTC